MYFSFCSAALGFLDLFQVQQMTNHPLLLADNRLSIKPCFCMVTLLWSSRLWRNIHNWKARKMSTRGCSKADGGKKKPTLNNLALLFFSFLRESGLDPHALLLLRLEQQMVRNDSWWRQRKVFITLRDCAGDFKNKGFRSDKKWWLAEEMAIKLPATWGNAPSLIFIASDCKLKWKKLTPGRKEYSASASRALKRKGEKHSLIFRFDFFSIACWLPSKEI